MDLDRERRRKLEQEKSDIEADIRKLLDATGDPAISVARQTLSDRIRAIDNELTRMEFAIEFERQSDA